MRNLAILVCVTFLCQAGCQKPAPLTVEPPAAPPAGTLSVTVLANPDTNIAVNPIDSVGVLPTDQTNYSGFFLVNSVKYDYGHGAISGASASAYFGDRNSPLVVNGKIVVYYGLDLMPSAVFPPENRGDPAGPVPLQNTYREPRHDIWLHLPCARILPGNDPAPDKV